MTATSGASRSFPTLRYLAAPFRWLFGSRRRVLTVAVVLLAMIAAPVLWWATQLVGLPDVGDPFDVEAFRSFTIPDDRNAFVLYRQAADRLKPLITSSKAQEQAINLHAPWSQADPAVHRWVEDNREPMALFRRGTERPDALDPDLSSGSESSKMAQALRSFHELALLEASRLEERGDMEGAWGWYRTALRASYHFGLRATGTHRSVSLNWRGELLTRLTDWSSDQRTTPAMVRRALDDVVACSALDPSDSYTLRVEYPDVMRTLDSSWNPGHASPPKRLLDILGSSEYRLSREQAQAIVHAWRFLKREPERSRRVIRLAVANWLACYDLPPERRPKPDPNVPGLLRFYVLGPDAPANARALSPEALDRWLATTIDATPMLREWNPAGIRLREARSHRALVVQLASELYRRDHGSIPLWDEALVGPYLKELPPDGLDDGDAPVGPAAERSSGAGASTEQEP